ncbi:MAG: 30S ribosomal protein S8 [Bdellovibrionales bacterium]|nr:30S ribosomal protein S8 [Bdellovibrionales bacterium]
MSLTDPIADFLTRLRNAQRARHEVVTTAYSIMNEEIAKILKNQGFITEYKIITDPDHALMKTLEVTLRYSSTMAPVIQDLSRISKPGRRQYVTKDALEKQLKTFVTTVVSTSKGVLTDRDAVAKNVGGELICRVS